VKIALIQHKGPLAKIGERPFRCAAPGEKDSPSAPFGRQTFALFFFFTSLRPPSASAAPAPNRRMPPGAGTGVPPEDVDVLLPPEVDVLLPPEVEVLELLEVDVLDPPVDVDELLDELFEDFELLDDLELFVDFELLPDLVLFVKLLFEALALFENKLDALASTGAVAAMDAVASAAPIKAAFVNLIYCIGCPSS
jgi:hypothetical protein